MKKKQIKFELFILASIIILSGFLRFYCLGSVPAGFHQDEVSQAFNSYSLSVWGRDRYGEVMPLLFRSFGSYQPSVYTYLSIASIKAFGTTIFAARFMSAFFGVLIVILTYLLVKEIFPERKNKAIAFISALIIGISPWAIHFSRRVVEGNLGLAFFLLSLLFLYKSLKKIALFPFAMFVLGISTHAYYSERLISVIFLPIFIYYFRDNYFRCRKVLIIGLLIFVITQIPHLMIMKSGAFSRRFDQVSYLNNVTGHSKVPFLFKEFGNHFIGYISPKNLFIDTGSSLARVSPNLGVFYFWMIIPFMIGIHKYIINRKTLIVKSAAVLCVVSLIPASLTGDIFYPLRALEYLWIIGVIISIGLNEIYIKMKQRKLMVFLLLAIIIYSLLLFYVSYFILFQTETDELKGSSYISVTNYLNQQKDMQILIDSSRDPAVGLRIAYLMKVDPRIISSILRPQLKTDYYSGEVDTNEVYTFFNYTFKPIDWRVDLCKYDIFIGDVLSISQKQIVEHKLKLVDVIKNKNNEDVYFSYKTPKQCF